MDELEGVTVVDCGFDEHAQVVVVNYRDYPVKWSGPFTICFEDSEDDPLPPCMPLLNLFPKYEASESIRLIKKLVDGFLDVDAEIAELFEQINWQQHLPAAVATVLSPRRVKAIPALWNAFDHGSWVMPQLAAVAYLVDPDFEANATGRVTNLCAVNSPRGLSSFDDHRLRGPANDLQRSAKGINALLALCATKPGLRDWHEKTISTEAVADLSARDIDGSASIAIDWVEGLLAEFESLGITVSRPD